jgi:fructose/tagatose bisphosphate aldolase
VSFIGSVKRGPINLICKYEKNNNICRSPVMIQFSNGGAAFMAGKGIKNTAEKAAILGAIAGAQHTRLMAKHY